MARLPVVGGDDGTWGDILNEFLGVSLNSGGKLQSVGALLVAASDSPDAIKAAAAYVCDGTADNVEIQAAIDALGADGGSVLLATGKFNIAATINIRNHGVGLHGLSGFVHRSSASSQLLGEGTKLFGATGLSGAVVDVRNSDSSLTLYGVSLKNLTIDGKDIATDGIFFRCRAGEVISVHVTDCTESGLRIQGASATWAAIDNFIGQCLFHSNTEDGLFFDSDSSDNHVTECIMMQNGRHGINIGGASQQITAVHCYDNSSNGIYCGSASETKIANCKIENNNGGIYVVGPSSGIIVTGCGFRGNSQTSSPNTYDHINLTGSSGNSCVRITITGCRFKSYTSAAGSNGPTRYAIAIENSFVQAVVITGNNFQQGGTVGTNEFGTGVLLYNGSTSNGLEILVRGNIGYYTEQSGTATVTNGNTSVTVTHRLGSPDNNPAQTLTPRTKDIQVTPTNSMGAATKYYITNPTSTTFDIVVDQNPGATTATFAWQIHYLYK